MKVLGNAPKTYPADAPLAKGVTGLFYEGLPWHKQPTRVFAYYGLPELAPGMKAPGMVLVHGGGGTAFDAWVRLWTSRGYAAIAMDTCGCVPIGSYGNWRRQKAGGPPGWGGFDQLDEPPEDQWAYHAVADVVLAHSLLRSLPGVDPQRIGLTGISWGGYLTCIVAGVDARFRFAVPVYGCGFLGDNSVWLPEFQKMGPARSARWLGRWDPSVWLVRSKMPMLWVTGTNDFAYPMDSLQKSYRLRRGRTPSAFARACRMGTAARARIQPRSSPSRKASFAAGNRLPGLRARVAMASRHGSRSTRQHPFKRLNCSTPARAADGRIASGRRLPQKSTPPPARRPPACRQGSRFTISI